jgi:hypothetical protein
VDTDLEALSTISDPAERAQRALAVIEGGRELMERAAAARAGAALELYREHGAAKAARLLGTTRVNVYRIIGQIPEVKQQRLSKAVEVSSLVVGIASAVSVAGYQNGRR